MEELDPVRSGHHDGHTDEHDCEDVEMRDGSESDGDEHMSEGPKESEENDKDKVHCLVRAWVQMNGTAEGLHATIYLMKPYYKFPGEHKAKSQERNHVVRTHADLNKDDILGEPHTQTVWDEYSSHFVSDTTSASGPRGM